MMQSKQDLFTKMNMDINPNKVSQEQGVFIKGVNGSVISDGGSNNFKWTSDTGTEHLFNLPYKTMVSEAQRYATANLYYFDGRSIGFGVESPTSSRSFLFEVYKSNIKKGFVYAENVHNVSFATYTIKIYIELEGLGYNTTEVVTAGTLGSWSIEHYLLNKTVTLFNTIPSGNRGNLSWSLKRHFVQPAFLTDIDKELQTTAAGYTDFTWYIEFQYQEAGANIGLLCREVNDGDFVYGFTRIANAFSYNKLGWGRGSINGSPIEFPASAPFPTPGTNKEDIYSEPVPEGRAIAYKQDQLYYAYDGGGYKTNILQKNPVVTDTTFDSPTYVNPFVKGDFILLAPALNESVYTDGILIEVNPRTFAYSLLQNQYKAAIEIPAQDIEVVYSKRLSVNKIILFCVTGEDYERLIYIVDFSNKVPETTLVLSTTEDIDFGVANPIRNCHVRYESDEYYYVYWSAQKGFLRELNLAKPITKDYDFNTRVHKPVRFGKVQTSKVYRNGGTLLVGAYQFCYSLSIDGVNYTRCSVHTNAVHIGTAKGYSEEINEEEKTIGRPQPVPLTMARYKGGEAGTKTTNSIEVRITNIDRRYRYIKLYSIEAVSGSGQYGSAVINEIHTGELSNSDYYEFLRVYTGLNDIVSGGLNISQVTKPTIVPCNIKSFFFNENRLVIAGYDEFVKQITDSERSALLGGLQAWYVSEPIGCDRSVPAITTKPKNNGHKNEINQQFKKGLAQMEYEFAWVFEDEYGNTTEPEKCMTWGGRLSFNDAEQHLFLFAPKDTIDHIAYNVTPDHVDPYEDPIGAVKVYKSGGYIMNPQGIAVKQAQNTFPSWAKKARLVRRIKDFSKTDIIYFTGLPAEGANAMFIPDLLGFNSFKRVGLNEGDLVVVIAACNVQNNESVIRMAEKPDGTIHKESLLAFFQNGATAGVNRTQLYYASANIVRISDGKAINTKAAYGYPLSYDTKITVPIIKVEPAYTISLPGMVTNAGLGYLPQPIHFGFILKRKNASDSADIVYYEDTGCEFDLSAPLTKKKTNFFPGDQFMGTINCPIMYKKEDSDNRVEASTLLVPTISQYNYSMANPGWFIEEEDSEARKELLAINRDYGVTNNWNKHLFISDEYLKERTSFANTVIYSDAREPNTKFSPFGALKSNNIVDLFVNRGTITAIEEFNDVIYVFYERGIKQLFPSEKEFMQSSSGTRVAVGDGSYLVSKDRDFSETKGTAYPVLKTNKGIYFYDGQTNTLNRISKGLEDLSLAGQCKTFFEKLTADETNISEWTGVFLNYNEIDERVFITLSTKEVAETVAKIVSTTAFAFIIKKDRFRIGDAVIIQTNGFVGFGIITAIQDENGNKIAIVTRKENNKLTYSHLEVAATGVYAAATVTKATYSLETIVFNEKIDAFEKLTDKVLTTSASASDRHIAIDPITHQSLSLYETENEENITAFETTGVNFNPRYLLAKNAWHIVNGTVDVYAKQNSVSITTPVRKFKFIGTNLRINEFRMLAMTKRNFLFLKGYKYRITGGLLYDCTTPTANSDKARLTIPYEFLPFITSLSGTEPALIAGFSRTLTMDIEFLVDETFEAPLVLCFDTLTGAITQAELTITEFSKSIALVPELTVVMNGAGYREEQVNMNTNKYVYDNGIVATNIIGSELQVEALGSEMTIPSITGIGTIKQRLQEYRYAIPYSVSEEGAKQRQRGVYHIVKYSFINYVKKFSLNSVKHLFRKSS